MKLDKTKEREIEAQRSQVTKQVLSEALMLHRKHHSPSSTSTLTQENRRGGGTIYFLDRKPLVEFMPPYVDGDRVEMPYKIFEP